MILFENNPTQIDTLFITFYQPLCNNQKGYEFENVIYKKKE